MKQINVFQRNVPLIIFLIFSALNIQSQIAVQFGAGEARLNYEDGLLTGDYASFYQNGNRKVEGQFENNRRVGTWKFYNEDGDLVIVRDHTAPLCVKQEIPVMETECGTADFEKLRYKQLKEENIEALVRCSRLISVEENPSIKTFDLALIQKAFEGRNLKLYEFSEFYYLSKELEDVDFSKYEGLKFIGFLLQSESVMQNDYLVYEERPLGIVPVFETEAGELVHDMALYYPGSREFLQNQNVTGDLFSNLDEMFFRNAGVSAVIVTIGRESAGYGPELHKNMFYPENSEAYQLERARLEATVIEQLNDGIFYFFSQSEEQ